MSLKKIDWPEFKAYLLSRARQKNTKDNIASLKSRFFTIKRFFAKLCFTPDNFDLFITKMIEHGYKNEYINKFITLAKHLARYNHREGFETLKRFQTEAPNYEPMTYEEMAKISNCFYPYKRGAQLRNQVMSALYGVMIETGGRIGEVLNLSQVDVFDQTVTFTDTKSFKKRSVPISRPLYNKLINLHCKSRYLFYGHKSTHLSRISVMEDLKARCKRLQIRKLKEGTRTYPWPHLFRISVATLLVKRGMHILDIMKILGHESPDTTARYAKTDIEHLRRMIENYHPAFARIYTLEEMGEMLGKQIRVILNPSRFYYIIKRGKNTLAIKIAKV